MTTADPHRVKTTRGTSVATLNVGWTCPGIPKEKKRCNAKVDAGTDCKCGNTRDRTWKCNLCGIFVSADYDQCDTEMCLGVNPARAEYTAVVPSARDRTWKCNSCGRFVSAGKWCDRDDDDEDDGKIDRCRGLNPKYAALPVVVPSPWAEDAAGVTEY